MKQLITLIILLSTVNVFASDYKCSAIKLRRGIGSTGILTSFPKSVATSQEKKFAYMDFGAHRVSSTVKLDAVMLAVEIECQTENNCSFHGRLDKWVTTDDGFFGLVADYQVNTITGKGSAYFSIDDNNVIRVKCE